MLCVVENALSNLHKCSCFDPVPVPRVLAEIAAPYTNTGFVRLYQLCINWFAGIKGIIALT